MEETMKQLSFFDYPDLTVEDKPQQQVREVLCAYAEEQKLLAGIIGQANARKLFEAFPGTQLIVNASVSELAVAVGEKAAQKLQAILNLSRKVFNDNVTHIGGPKDVYDLMQRYATADKEHFWVITLNTRMNVLGVHQIYSGSINAVSNFRLAELLRPAIVMNANGIILVHNHPTGESDPSSQDIGATRELYRAGKELGISVLDHIVIGKDYCSIKENSPTAFQ
jgi:DNA repair protein RadC